MHAEHGGQKLVGECEAILPHAVLSHQQPAGAALVETVQGVARRDVNQLGDVDLCIPSDEVLEGALTSEFTAKRFYRHHFGRPAGDLSHRPVERLGHRSIGRMDRDIVVAGDTMRWWCALSIGSALLLFGSAAAEAAKPRLSIPRRPSGLGGPGDPTQMHALSIVTPSCA